MLLQIEEQGKISEHFKPVQVIGIDLGTTHTVISIVHNDRIQTIDVDHQKLIPSVIAYENNQFIIGKKAQPIANAVHSIKRHMHQPLYKRAFEKTVVELSAEILKFCRLQASQALKENITHAVITVPAYFDDTQRQATKDAAELAGLKVLRLINEPTAAALAYDLDKGKEGTYLIYDLGGGTFDVSLLKFNKGIFQVIATGGDTALGGDDIDQLILNELNLENNNTNKLKAQQIKHDISNNIQSAEISKEKFETFCKPFIEKTLKICDQVLNDAQISIDDILGIVFVGGSTRLYNLHRYIQNYFHKQIFQDIDPDLCVSWGAAIQAHALTYKNNGTLLLDVTPLSLGIETMGGLFEKIIPRNTPIPIKKAQDFTTYEDGQTTLKIHVFQGERELIKDCRSLAQFTLKNIPPMPAGMVRIRITFSLDVDGILTVSAEELYTQKKQVIDIKPSYGLTEEQLKDMIFEAHQSGQEDIQNRLLQESIIQAKHLMVVIEKAIQTDGDLLDKDTHRIILDLLQKIKDSIAQKDRDMIERYKNEVSQATQNFAEQRLERSIAKKLVGKGIGAE